MMRYALLRMARSYLALLLLVGVPLVLIAVIGTVSDYLQIERYGDTSLPGMDYLAVSMVLGFQLFGGAYTMEFFKSDLLDARKWRLHALPLRIDRYGMALLLGSTVFTMLQGLAMAIFTQLMFGVNWGNYAWLVVVLAAVSFLSQLVGLVLILSLRSAKLAERLSEVYGIGSMLLAGFALPMPDTPLFEFFGRYGNPLSLGQNAVFGMLYGNDRLLPLLSVGLLFTASALLLPLAAAAGRRKLG
ncbi:ABC transporter permease [Paenibacillus sp. IB182496]|uniref:ABC transporter permease n=1 Tax=Paenibacillus sabuli TaxID=2772509 RepID=A0A927GS17_9BACL|nr:ABC transporter permease [Paenibacillus sabuli]MBD2846078.1 ABC transporter permease [Paenibacillus sabuli]